MSIQEKRERRHAIATQLVDLQKATEGKPWGAPEQEKYDGLMNGVKAMDAEIKRDQDIMNLEAENRIPILDAGERNEVKKDKLSPKAIYHTYLRGGYGAMDTEQIAAIRNTMSTTTTTEGGYTVQTEVASSIMEALKSYGGMRDAATVLRTEKGNPLAYPTSDGTSETGEQLAENATAAALDMSFGTVALDTYKYSSKSIAIPMELLQDSQVDLEAYINERLRTRIGRITNTRFTLGTGSSQPRGVVVASGAGKVGASGQVATVLYNDLVDVMHSVDPAYRFNPGSRWMMSDAALKMLYKLADGDGRPIFWADTKDLSEALPMTLLGRPITINQDMAAPAASAKSILFGDFSKYIIRDAMDIQVFRFTDSAFTLKGQVGFVALSRHGGNYTDVGASMKHYVHAAS